MAGGTAVSDFYRSTPVKRTRRACRCRWCDELIEAGQPSVYVAGLYEDFFTARFHPECDEAVSRWYRENQCYGEPWPEDPMNRGGIQHKGEEERR
jgi:hypothetical protein